MTPGLWTPVEGGNQNVIFSEPLMTFANRVKTITVPAGLHLRITTNVCAPIYVRTTLPTTNAEGFAGTPVHEELIIPRVATLYIFCPHELQTVHIGVGTLTMGML